MLETQSISLIDNQDSASSVSVIIPAYEEEAVIGSVIVKVHRVLSRLNLHYEIIVVDDGSKDATARAARDADAVVISHPYNIGNGAAIKTGIRHASGTAFIFMDGDGQHNPEDIPRFLKELETYDMVVGARTSESETTYHRTLANSVYNELASYVCGRKILDLTSGFRAVRANVAREFLNLLPNTFSYPTTITLAVVRSGYSLAYIPIKVARRTGKSKIKLLRDGTRFLLIIFKITTLFSPLKVFVPASLFMFLLGFGYGLFKVVLLHGSYGPTSAMLMTISIVVFLIGLVSEQIAQMRFEQIASLRPALIQEVKE